jgi:fumarate hydratase, class II
MPADLIQEIGVLKKTAVLVNRDLRKLPKEKVDLIIAAADEVVAGKLHAQFAPQIWQTGNGTQTNMNVNEVISDRAIKIVGDKKDRKEAIHPNDDVNMSQSFNDIFPTAMYVAVAIVLTENLTPALKALHAVLEAKSPELAATPLIVDQEILGWSSLIERDLGWIRLAIDGFYALATGGTTVATDLKAQPEFAQRNGKT